MQHARRRKIFFFHNPKAAGNSVGHFLERCSCVEDASPVIENSQRDHERLNGQYASFRNHQFYSGHYGYDIFSAVNDGHAAITNLRDPAPRLLSLYNYYRCQGGGPDDPAQHYDYYSVRFAKSVDFHTFVSTSDPRIEVHTRDHHVRQLTNSGWAVGSQGDLVHATALLDGMPWYYVCEYPKLSEAWARAVFGTGAGSIQRLNVTSAERAVTTVTPKTLRVIRDKNPLDTALHAYATRRLLRRGGLTVGDRFTTQVRHGWRAALGSLAGRSWGSATARR